MRYLLYAMLLIVFAGCQKEELTVVQAPDGESFLRDGQLRSLIMSVVSHDGSYDDIIDSSSCFSINFPYTCIYGGKEYLVNSIEDLSVFNEGMNLTPKFPIIITFADYISAEVPNADAFEDFKIACANGTLFNESITCIDINYPVDISIYNTVTSNFETISFLHDKQTFQTIEEMDQSLIANIQYPIEILLPNNVVLTIESNEVLKSEILSMIPICE